jgi:ribose-phosphate pyrophosphokinase
MKSSIKIVAGNSNRPLAEAISAYLDVPLAPLPGEAVRRHGGVRRDPAERARRGRVRRPVDLVPGERPPDGAAHHDRCAAPLLGAPHHGGDPYFGYARQDRKPGPRTPISAKLVANLITRAGADRVLTLDLHAGQIQGFFDIPTDNLFAAPVMVRDIKERLREGNRMVISPDVGGVVRARALAKRIDAPLAIVDKRRERPGESEVMNIIGEVEGRSCILVDDIVDSGGTLVNAAEALLAHGAKEVYAYITHGVLSGGAVSRIANSKLKELVITDSIQPTEAVKVARNIR